MTQRPEDVQQQPQEAQQVQQGQQPQVVYVQQAPSRGTSGMAIASLVLGILWMGGLGALLAIIFGAIGMKQTRDGQVGGRGLAIAGLILGIIGVIGAIAVRVPCSRVELDRRLHQCRDLLVPNRTRTEI